MKAFALLLAACVLCRAVRVPGNIHKSRPGIKAAQRTRIEYTDAAQDDKVEDLPGWGPIEDFDMFSGYVTVDEAAGRKLFYVFVTSTNDPVGDPLLLWLNGGPGCSSLGGGFMSELGPWLPLPGGTTLQANPYSWNKVSNTLYVESPAFVGFSTSDDPADRIVGDERTAQDMRKFLLGFIQRFPHLADNDLYLSGESYAGHYVPGLAWEIVKGNSGGGDRPLNLAGLLVGNPWTDAAIDNLGAVDYWWAHALISDTTAHGIKANCDFAHIGPLDAHPYTPNPVTKAEVCDKFCNRAFNELGPINIYQIYADTCPPAPAARAAAAFARALAQPLASDSAEAGSSTATNPASPSEALGTLGAVAAAGLTRAARKAATGTAAAAAAAAEGTATSQKASVRRSSDDDADDIDGDDGNAPPEPAYDPCVDDEVETYLNLPQVQRALHANVSGELPGPWTDCTRRIRYSREDLLSSMLPTWQQLLAASNRRGNRPLRFLVYSGDVDGIVPVVGTRRWVSGLGLKEASAWRPWISGATGQVGGWVVEYDLPGPTTASSTTNDAGSTNDKGRVAVKDAVQGGLMFATVRNAGHMVPYTQPQRALHLVTHFLKGKEM
eukprot:CAMPEP_0202867848 /NCGR_PEP_ID=MMETSP1391-20130828/9657_1 /ASSEMBLY_ACC=CAM_ASM_000867 /TAXON_ID=1034604 /ORGANISM="Chlamydomonas leiostraca, Strain SAG 11-49" /LENGTH=607 /DNA_ID=CAMNT_0049547925 /DNA_START=146 /DNA_END=1969 /DNA_ORIENTATION=-